MLKPKRIFLRIALALLVPLVLVELGLQAAAVVVWYRARPQKQERHDGRVKIVCLGDSFTYGLGAATAQGSYPAQLQEQLNARAPGRFDVINRGWPGNNSADLLGHVDAVLQEYAPNLVCIMVGMNDIWSRPAHVDAQALR